MTDALTSPKIRFADFVDRIVERVPGIPRTAGEGFDLTRHGLLDHFQRTGVRRAAAQLAPQLDPAAFDSCVTLGDLFAVVGATEFAEGEERGTYRGPQVRLRPLEPADYGALYVASLDPVSSFRWRFRGRTPSPQEFEESLFAGVVAQFAVVDLASGALHGLVSAYDHRPEVGSCYFAFQRADGSDASLGGELVEGAFLFLDYLFTTFNLRRVRVELPEFNRYLVEGLLGDVLKLEGTLEEYLWYNGAYWAMLCLAIDRCTWESVSGPYFGVDRRQSLSSH